MCPGSSEAQQRLSNLAGSTGECCWGARVLKHSVGFNHCPPQLTLAVHNVPDLSVGVSCAFEEVTESDAVLLPSGELRCLAPSLQELRMLTRGHGECRGGNLGWGTVSGTNLTAHPILLQEPHARCGCVCCPRRQA